MYPPRPPPTLKALAVYCSNKGLPLIHKSMKIPAKVAIFLLIACAFLGAKQVDAFYSPFYYTQTFDHLNQGTLNGQDGWVTGSHFDVTMGKGIEGINAVYGKCTTDIARKTMANDINVGSFYFSVRFDEITTSNAVWAFYTSSSVQAMAVKFDSGTFYMRDYTQAQYVPIYSGATTTKWYTVKMSLISGAKTYSAQINDGSGWTDVRTYQTPTITGVKEFQYDLCPGVTSNDKVSFDNFTVVDPYANTFTKDQVLGTINTAFLNLHLLAAMILAILVAMFILMVFV